MRHAFMCPTRALPLLTVALLLAGAGCQSKPDIAAPAPPAVQHQVVAGEANKFFSAASSKAITIARDVRVVPIKDGDGRQRGAQLIARDNGTLSVACLCPGGCSGSPDLDPDGCLTVYDPGSDQLTCAGLCSAPDRSCMDCSMTFPSDGDGTRNAPEQEPTDVSPEAAPSAGDKPAAAR